MIEIRLPRPGPETDNATITKWECSEGDKIQVGSILAIIKTPIGSFKVAAEEQGILDQILQPEGNPIDFDEPIAILHPDISISDFPNISEDQDSTIPLAIEGVESTEDESSDSSELIEESSMPSDDEMEPDSPEPAAEDSALKLAVDDSPAQETPEPAETNEAPEAIETNPAQEPQETPQEPSTLDVEVSPAAERIAERHGIDLRTVTGTGDQGKILYIDVENVIAAQHSEAESQNDEPDADGQNHEAEDSDKVEDAEEAPLVLDSTPEEPELEQDHAADEPVQETHAQATAEPETSGEEEIKEIKLEEVEKPTPDFDEISVQFHLAKKDDLIIPFNSIKKSFSDLHTEGARTVPQLYLGVEIDCSDLPKWIEDYNLRYNSSVGLLDLIIKASGHALALIPEMNAYVRPDRLILKRSINIGVTTTVDEGVVTPVIPDVYHKSLVKVSEVAAKNHELAVSTKVVLDYDTTFTITSLAGQGVKHLQTPITPRRPHAWQSGPLRRKSSQWKTLLVSANSWS
jgi:pyruvate/2-oxoglutarate dehydrogenase complex dihydrolipoamide acyltransferase (E2) component